MTSAKWAVVATVLTALGASCSSAAHSAVPPTTTLARPARLSTTTSAPPPVVGITASREPWKLPAAVSRPVVLPSGRGFVILGGLQTGDTSTTRIVAVNPATGDARIDGQLAVAVHDSAGAAIGGRFFVFGGGAASTLSAVQAWSTTGPATQVASLPEARSDLSAATLAGTTYIVGGFNGSVMTSAVLATTDGVSFRTVAQLAVPVRYPAVAAFGDSLWVIGGVISTSEGGTAETDAVQHVNLRTGRVTLTGRLPRPMGHATALTLDGGVFVLGGRSGAVPSAAIWRLDPGSGALALAGQLPTPVSDAGSVVVGAVGYLVGGEFSGPSQPLDSVVVLRPRL